MQSSYGISLPYYSQTEPMTNPVFNKPASLDKRKKWFPAGKKEQPQNPELARLSDAYFCERWLVLLQLLQTYNPADNNVLIKATPKTTK